MALQTHQRQMGGHGDGRSAKRCATADPGQWDPAEEPVEQSDHAMDALRSARQGELMGAARTEVELRQRVTQVTSPHGESRGLLGVERHAMRPQGENWPSSAWAISSRPLPARSKRHAALPRRSTSR
jgi:hypothetical protein